MASTALEGVHLSCDEPVPGSKLRVRRELGLHPPSSDFQAHATSAADAGSSVGDDVLDA
jgi:hypothetical protein